MPYSARSTCTKRQRAYLGLAAIALLAVVIAFGTPFTGRASAATIPMVFPLEIRVPVLHDYLAPRSGHLHQGTDLMAPKMTKELACVSGTVTLRVGTYNGLPEYSLWLAGDDGHGYFYIHINNDTPGTSDDHGGLKWAFAPGLVSGAHVKQGQFIAYCGNSGNAENTATHLHFEIHQTTSMASASMNPYDSLVNAPLYGGAQPPSTGINRYEQTDSNILYLGKWVTFVTSGASGGTYTYADSPATALIWFNGTKLDLIATKGYTQGKARVSLDGVDKGTVDFSNATTLRQQKVWSTGTVAAGTHKVVLSWTGQSGVSGGTRINVDAVDVTGTLVKADLTTVEQTDPGLVYNGTWTTSSATSASGGSFAYTNSTGSAVTIKFTGSHLVWVTKKSPVYGIAKVILDGGSSVNIDLYSASEVYKQKVWNTGVVSNGPHTVVIEWTGTKNVSATATNVGIDAVQVLGTVG